MNRNAKNSRPTAPVLALVAMAAACGGPEDPPRGSTVPQVVATTTIVADLVRRVGEPDVAVVSLMGAGVDPHLWEATAGDVRRMASAAAIFYTGHHLEGKMTELFAGMRERGRKTVAVAECLPAERLLPAGKDTALKDPHLWFDVGLWAETLPCVAQALAEIVPARAEEFRRRAAEYEQELGSLDAEVRAQLAAIPAERRVLITAHDAFAYFGRAYGVEVRGLMGISTAAEAGAEDVQRLAEFIAARRVPAVFVESSVSPRAVQALAEAVKARGHRVAMGGSLYSDALGSPGTPAETYVGMVRANVATIVAALSGDRGADP